jgi:hypothetical protein
MVSTFSVYATQGRGVIMDRLPEGRRAYVTLVEADGDRLLVTLDHPGTRLDALCTLTLCLRRLMLDAGLHHCSLSCRDTALPEAA